MSEGGRRRIARKEYYSIGEVCRLVDLKPHVLRYWESRFRSLRPSKNRSGNRVYQQKEIELILLLKHLLYEEKYTIGGARQWLEQHPHGSSTDSNADRAAAEELVGFVRGELRQLLDVLAPAEPQ